MRTMSNLRLVKSISTEKDLVTFILNRFSFFIRFILDVYLNQHCVFVWLISIIVKFCILAANDFDKTGFSTTIYPVKPKCINLRLFDILRNLYFSLNLIQSYIRDKLERYIPNEIMKILLRIT